MIKYIKENKIPIIIALVHFFVSTFFMFDKNFFDYPKVIFINMLLIKILYFISLFIFWGFNFHVYRKIKKNDEQYKRGFKLFIIYFSIMIGLIFLVWPGLWGNDDIWCLNGVFHYFFSSWHNVLTSISQCLFLQYLPFMAGIIIIQNYIISICASFIITKIETSYNIHLKNKFLDYLLKIFPFLLIPLIRYQLSGYRMGLYVYLELTMFCIIFFAIKNKEKWSYSYLMLFSFLCILTSVWRTESLFYCVIIGLILLLTKNIGNIKKRIIGFLIILIGSLLLNGYQKVALGNENYKIMSTVRQVTVLVRAANPITEKEHLQNIDKVIVLQKIFDNPDKNGEELTFDGKFIRKTYTKKEYKNYLKSILMLSKSHFNEIFKERFFVFINTSSKLNWTGQNDLIGNTKNDPESTPVLKIYNKISDKSILNNIFFPQIKLLMIQIICLDNYKKISAIIWNFFPPIIALFLFCYYFFKQKKYIKLILFSTLFLKLFIIILTAPATIFMYYLSFYLIGYVIIFYSFINHLCKKRKIKNA